MELKDNQKKSLNRTYSAPLGGISVIIIFYYSNLVKMQWVSSIKHFLFLLMLVVFTSVAVTSLDYLKNQDILYERSIIKKFVFFRIFLTMGLCMLLLLITFLPKLR